MNTGKKIVIIALVLALIACAISGALALNNRYPACFIVDRGMVDSYVDRYGFTHGEVYWLILSDDEGNRYTKYVSAATWYVQSVGGYYMLTPDAIPYEGDDSVARDLYRGGETNAIR